LKDNLKINLMKQLQILKKATSFLDNKKNKRYDSSLNYLDSIEKNPGYGLVQFWNKGIVKIPILLFLLLKDFLLSFYEFKFTQINKLKKKKFQNIIISWSRIHNFEKNGSFNDPYFNTNSNLNKSCIWFLIHMDNKIPKKISNNIVIIKKKSGKYNYAKLISFFINIQNFTTNISSMIHTESHQTKIAYAIFNKFKYLLKNNLKKIIMPYEGQPFQNLIIKKTLEFNKSISTIGFVHNFLPALPTSLIYRNGSPKKIIVSNIDHKYFFNKYLSWSKKRIQIKMSARFIDKKKEMSGKIFLPSHINSLDFIISNLKILLINYSSINIQNFEIRNHPQKLKSNKHIVAINKIKKILKANYKKKNIIKNNLKKSNISIFIGSTGAIIEALKYNCAVVHIVEDPVLQIYSKLLYPNIKTKIINEHIYYYYLSGTNKIIKLGKKNHTFKSYLK
jgi:hypothetical protein